MQLIEPALLTELWSVTGVMAHVPANAGGAPPPIITATTDDDANRSSDRRAMRRPIAPPKGDVGTKACEQRTARAFDGEDV
jgi:hypothetical protein